MFRDEASCAGIKLNPLGQIRFVSSWGNPRLLQVQARSCVSRDWLEAVRLAGWPGATMMAIGAVERL